MQIGVLFHLTTNRKSLVGFQNMGSDLKFGAPSGEFGMTSFPVIEKRPITPNPLQIGVSFLLTTNMKSLVGFQNMRSDLKLHHYITSFCQLTQLWELYLMIWLPTY